MPNKTRRDGCVEQPETSLANKLFKRLQQSQRSVLTEYLTLADLRRPTSRCSAAVGRASS